jgi:putative NADPH-quinone reductase
MSSDPHRVLILFAHPALERSRVNRVLIRDLDQLDGVTFHDLYEAYPDFDVDVAREQALLLEHDTIVLQHPFYWYSTPALIKQWEDLVLQHGWAYGHEGNALRGKLPPFIVYGTLAMTPEEAQAHATEYRRLLVALTRGEIIEEAEG